MAVSTKQMPTLKTVIIATVQELIASLKTFYAGVVENIFSHVRKQDEIITKQATLITENQTRIINLQTELLNAKQELLEAKGKIANVTDVKLLERRMRELTYVCQALYALIYEKAPELISELPDLDNVVLPDDSQEGSTDTTTP